MMIVKIYNSTFQLKSEDSRNIKLLSLSPLVTETNQVLIFESFPKEQNEYLQILIFITHATLMIDRDANTMDVSTS